MVDRPAARAALLQKLTLEVGKAADAQSAAASVVRVGRELMGGLSSVLWLVDAGGALDLLASDGVPEAFLEQWRRVLPTDDVPAMRAVVQGGPLWVASMEEYRGFSETIAARAREADRPLAFAALPLALEGRNLGVLVFGFAAPHPFDEQEKGVALAVAGAAAQALERARLQAAQARALAGLRVIAKVGEMVSASLDVDATLAAFARAVVPDVADWCAIDLFVDGNVRRLTAHHADPAKVQLAREYAARFPSRLDDPRDSLARILATGEPVWVRRITPEMLDQGVPDREQLSILLSLGLRSTVQAPLVSEGRVRGVVTFIMSESGREYDEVERDLLVETGRRAGFALTNAALYAREQRARDRSSRLASVTAALARAPTTADVGVVACREGAAALGATTAALYALEGDSLRVVAHSDDGDDFPAAYALIPLAHDVPIARAARRNEPVVVESRAQLAREFPQAAGALPAERTALAFMCKPLAGRGGRVVGALAFGFAGERAFADDERAFARTLADHCAQAFERARILDLERTARERLALLAAAGETFSATIDYEATLRAVVRVALPALGDFGFFDVVEGGGEVRRTSGVYEDPEGAAALAQSRWRRSERADADLCALSTGRAAIHPDVDDALLRDLATGEGHLAALRALRLCSMITVPAVARGEVIGALTLCYGRSGRRHTEDELEIARELARRAAVAVEQARLYRASQEAARRAEEANRLKDEFLATVSHELRTPLNAILGWASLLLDGTLDERNRQRALETIARNARAQARLIEDLLDLSRILQGKFVLSVGPAELVRVVEAALDAVRPAAEAKGVRLQPVLDSHATIVGDPGRLQQVAWNLLSNAIKFTPRGGRVQVTVRRAHSYVELEVADTGQGIEPDFLPHVFEPFRQADGGITRRTGGLGLGLSIVRSLVELHGGTVAARSDGAGLGSTFVVRLPMAPLRADGAPPEPEPTPGEPGRVSFACPPALAGLRVLVVDDEPDTRSLLAFVLGQCEAHVTAAGSAAEAFAALTAARFDVLLSDVGMPGEDGLSLIRRVRELSPGSNGRIPAVALTAYARGEDRARALRAGFSAHLAKPVEPSELALVVAALVTNGGSQ
jgi:signal transduction histidine kinase/ActR/RegA family two-component response regulator